MTILNSHIADCSCLQVPTYKEGSTIINESMAIVQWLEVAHPEKSLMPKGKEAEVHSSAGSSESSWALICCHCMRCSHSEKSMMLKGPRCQGGVSAHRRGCKTAAVCFLFTHAAAPFPTPASPGTAPSPHQAGLPLCC